MVLREQTFWKASLSGVAKTLITGAMVMAALVGGSAAAREESARNEVRGASSVSLAALPAQAQQTYQLILQAGPFPYPHKDGSVFGNRERQLPRQARGYYREYTVPTPGGPDRGARRIVCGGERPASPEVCYYTQDHYASFRRIVQ